MVKIELLVEYSRVSKTTHFDTNFMSLYSVQFPNDRAAIFTKAYAVVRLYYTQLQIRFPLKMRTDDYL